MTFFTRAVWSWLFSLLFAEPFSNLFLLVPFFQVPLVLVFLIQVYQFIFLLLAYTTKICTTAMVAIAMIIAADTCHQKSNPVVNIPKVAVLRIAFDIFPSSTIFTGLLRQYANKLFSRTLFWSSSSTSTLSAFINLHNSGL